MAYQWDFWPVLQAWPVLLQGFFGTLKLAALAVLGASAIGLLAGVCRTTKGPLSWLAGAYVEVFRNTPVLIQLFLIFYLIPLFFGVSNSPFLVAVCALSLYKGCYVAEIVRSGVQSIEKGQWDAAKAIGLSYRGQLRHVVLPQAVRRMLPAFVNRAIETFKLTTIASLVVYPELLYQTKLVAESDFRPIEAYTILALFFAFAVLPISYAARRLERRLNSYR